MSFDAWWLPGLQDAADFSTLVAGSALFQYPNLTSENVRAVCSSVRSAGLAARTRTVRERIAAVDRAAALLTDQNGSFFREACDLVAAATGYSPEMTCHVILRMAQDWSAEALQRLIAAELPDPDALEAPVPDARAGRRIAAFGPRLTAHIFSGNVPGVAVTSLIRALLVKSASFGKTAREEPALPVLFARALHKVDAQLAATLAVAYWPGGSAEPESALFGEADAAVVYGGPDAVEAARRHARPDCRLVIHGPRISLGIVAPPALGFDRLPATAARIAEAVATFDQQGCVSPHVIYVLGSIEQAQTLGSALATALEALQEKLPRGRLSTVEAVAMQDARARAEFRAINGENIVLHVGLSGAFTVVVDPDDGFVPSCLNRFVYLKPLARTARLDPLLSGLRPHLQAVALEGFTEKESIELTTLLGQLGVSRIAGFQGLPWPPPEWHHDGAGPLRELLRWVDVET